MTGRPDTLLIRADANATLGTGHVMRCLALAQAWQDTGGRVVFAMAPGAPALEKRLDEEGMAVRRVQAVPGSPDDSNQTATLAGTLDAAWTVVDGYHFGADMQKALQQAGRRTLWIDDEGHAGEYCADLVLNQNLGADESRYAHRSENTRLLLGTRYALLRREFALWRGTTHTIAEWVRKVLVTLGGGDAENVTGRVLQALDACNPMADSLEFTVLVGGANPHRAELERQAATSSLSIQLLYNTSDMPGLLAASDLAISAGGSTCWEMCFLGLPALLIVVADNQRDIARGLHDAGAAVNLGWHADLSLGLMREAFQTWINSSKSQRGPMSQTGQLLVDGQGIARVLSACKGALR
jgi:UDP-2,4-diacetamido-2,4,6-trideoxy-beta-L-altropyranose hydrolase